MMSFVSTDDHDFSRVLNGIKAPFRDAPSSATNGGSYSLRPSISARPSLSQPGQLFLASSLITTWVYSCATTPLNIGVNLLTPPIGRRIFPSYCPPDHSGLYVAIRYSFLV